MERNSAECPECAASVALDEKVVSGEIVQCGDCGVELEVVRDGDIALRRAPDEEEDWGE
jgi:alpha-aminoadipate carrier protein LysW